MPPPVAALVEALAEGWRWRLFDRQERLPSNSVSALYQDPEYYIYAATDSGLCRYDFWEWSLIQNAQPFEAGEVSRFVESLRVLYALAPRALWRLEAGTMLKVAYQGNGLHLASSLGEAFLIDEGKRRHLRIRGENIQPVDALEAEVRLPPGAILDYQVDSNRNHWLATATALFSRSLDRRRWREVEERELDPGLAGLRCARFFLLEAPPESSPRGEPPAPAAAAAQGELWALFQDPAGRARGGKLARLENGSWTLVCAHLESLPVQHMLRDAKGNYLATTEDGRLYASADGCGWFEVRNIGLGKVALYGGLLDSAGTLWFRVGSGGIAAFDPENQRWERIPSAQGQPFPNVLSLIETEKGEIWMGLKSGLSRYQAGKGLETYEKVQEVALEKITGLAEDTRHRVWVSSAESFNGAFYFDGANWGSESVPGFSDHPVRRIVRDRRGDLWFLSQQKSREDAYLLYRLSLSTRFALAAMAVDRGPVNDLLLTEDGVFWIATEAGLLRATPGEGEGDGEGRFLVERAYTEENGLRTRGIFAVAEGPDGAIWVCYPYTGVSRLQGDSVRHYGEAEGLATTAVWSIALQGQSLWVGTDLGLSRFDGECWYNLPVASAEAQRSNVRVVQPARRERDTMVVGTFGLGAFAYRNQPRGRPRFTSRQFPASAVAGEKVVLAWDARDYRNETAPQALLFRHRLDGKDWTPFSAARSCEFRALADGVHTFEVEVRDLDGNRNRDEEVHRFEVSSRLARPLDWLWLACAAAGFVALAGLAVLLVRRARNQRKLARYRRFFQEFPGPVFLIDRNASLADYNGVEPELVGIEQARREDILNRPLHLLSLFSSDEMRARLEKLLAGEPFLLKEERWGSPARGERILAVRGFPMRGAGGRVTGGVLMVEDRTRHRVEERHMERERRLSSLRHLADRVALVLRELLRELEEILRQSPAGDSAPRNRWLAERIRHLEAVARGLAAFSGRPAEASAALRVQPDEILGRILKESLNGTLAVVDEARRGSIRVDYRSQTGLWPVKVEEQSFSDALLEVLRNAWEAMPEGGVVTVRASNLRLDDDPGSLPSGSYVEIQVKDTGVGIDASQLERIFEPFYSTKPRERALGVGLSLAYGVVRSLGGDLRVESRPGKGTAVRILVPAAR